MASSVLNSGRISSSKFSIYEGKRQQATAYGPGRQGPCKGYLATDYRDRRQRKTKVYGIARRCLAQRDIFVSEPWNVKATSAGHIASNRTRLSRKTDGTFHI